SGPMALVGEEDLRLLYLPLEPSAQIEGIMPNSLPRVATIVAGLGEDLSLLDGLPADSLDGLVIAGVGMGHVSAAAVPRVARLISDGVPVVVATRVATGGTSTRHYDYPGSEVDLIENGAVMAGALPPQKARLLLQGLLSVGADRERIREEFEAYAYGASRTGRPPPRPPSRVFMRTHPLPTVSRQVTDWMASAAHPRAAPRALDTGPGPAALAPTAPREVT